MRVSRRTGEPWVGDGQEMLVVSWCRALGQAAEGEGQAGELHPWVWWGGRGEEGGGGGLAQLLALRTGLPACLQLQPQARLGLCQLSREPLSLRGFCLQGEKQQRGV